MPRGSLSSYVRVWSARIVVLPCASYVNDGDAPVALRAPPATGDAPTGAPVTDVDVNRSPEAGTTTRWARHQEPAPEFDLLGRERQ